MSNDPQRKISRRHMLAGTGSYLLLAPQVATAQESQPHLFINLFIKGGLDPHYLFDARALELTDAGYVQNFLYKNKEEGAEVLSANRAHPVIYEGTAGGKTLRTRLTDPLMQHMNDYSLVNGVIMAGKASVGHPQNTSQFLSGSIFGGDSFVPMIGSSVHTPLESVQYGRLLGATPRNFGRSVSLSGAGTGLAADLRQAADVDLSANTGLNTLLSAYSSGQGLFSQGVNAMKEALHQAQALKNVLVRLEPQQLSPMPDEDTSSIPSLAVTLGSALAYLKAGATRSVTIVLDCDPIIDTHGSAGNSLALYREIVKRIEFFMSTLKTTEYGNGQSFLDVTTVAIGSEFSRTARNLNTDVDGDAMGLGGTDHNSFNNSILLGGKGVRSGMIVGASDLQWGAGSLEPVSMAHRSVDAKLDRAIGKPFDFSTGQVRNDLPAQYKRENYLTIDSVVNTLLSIFGVDRDKWRAPRNGDPLPTINKLIG